MSPWRVLATNSNLYGELLTVTFKHKLRDEQAFDGLDALKAQIEQDIQTARDWFAENGASDG